VTQLIVGTLKTGTLGTKPLLKDQSMPTYQYECDACDHTFEILQTMLDKKLKKCPKCNKNSLYRLIGAGSGIIFKGSGFYETDYKRKDVAASESSDSKGTSIKDSKPKSDKAISSGNKENKSDKMQEAKGKLG